MSINKYKKLFEDKAGYKEVPFRVRIEIAHYLENYHNYDSSDEFESEFEALLHSWVVENVKELNGLADFDLEGTEIYQLAQEIEAKIREFENYTVDVWNIPPLAASGQQIDHIKNAFKNFENAYGENIDPLKHMSMQEFIDAFGEKD